MSKTDPSMPARSLIVIPCSGRKRHELRIGLKWAPEQSAVAGLSASSASALRAARHDLAALLGLSEGADLGGNSKIQAALMPARERYDGNLYRRIDPALWPDPSLSGLEVVIVSALYGLLTPLEPIRHYDAWMDQKIGERIRLSRWWKQRSLGSMLAEYLARSGAAVVHDFLSASYSVVGADLDGLDGIEVVRHKYPGLGNGADFHRGQDVRNLMAGGA